MNRTLRGVNLGGWLVLERWITPSLFEGFDAKDEMSFCLEVGEAKRSMLRKHWREFITAEDFEWLKDHGISAVRIPVGYWIFGDAEPYEGSIDVLDWAVETAGRCGMQVVIDIHGAPGSQNGSSHSGLTGEVGWHKNNGHVERTLSVVERLAKRYASQSNLWGIELLNEPSSSIPKKVLLGYYQRGYEIVREYCGDKVAVIISDAFNPRDWQAVMTGPDYENVILDCHMYQCFGKADKKLSIEQHLVKTVVEWQKLLAAVQRKRNVIVGEWSLGLDSSTFDAMDRFGRHVSTTAYGASQLLTFEKAGAWFFWTYKKEHRDNWDFRHCIQKGWLPMHSE